MQGIRVALERLSSLLGSSLFKKRFTGLTHATDMTRRWTIALQTLVDIILDLSIDQVNLVVPLRPYKKMIAGMVRAMGTFCKGALQTKEGPIESERYTGHTLDRLWIRKEIREALKALDEELGEWEHTDDEMGTKENVSDTDGEMDTGA